MADTTSAAPSDAEIDDLCDQFRWDTTEGRRACARAVLAKWGTPPAVAGDPVAWYEYNADLDAWFLAYSHNPKAKTRPLVFGDTTPQPTQAQAGAVPLNHRNIEPVRRFLADRGIYLSDETTKALIVAAHGIGTEKGDSHGLQT